MLNRGAWNIDVVHILEKRRPLEINIVIIWILEHFAKPTVRNMRSTYSMHGSMADCSKEQTIFCLNVISISKGLLFLIYAPINISRTTVQHMCNWKGIQILTIQGV
jgi:hypothetical protein